MPGPAGQDEQVRSGELGRQVTVGKFRAKAAPRKGTGVGEQVGWRHTAAAHCQPHVRAPQRGDRRGELRKPLVPPGAEPERRHQLKPGTLATVDGSRTG
jgi:hypothetical protein